MPLYPHQPVNGAQMAMQGMQQASQSYAAMGQKREQTTKQNTGVMDYVLPVGMLGYMGSKTEMGGKVVDAIGTGVKGAWEGLTGAATAPAAEVAAAQVAAAEAPAAMIGAGEISGAAGLETGSIAAASDAAAVTAGLETAAVTEAAAGTGATVAGAAEGAAAGSALGPIGMGVGLIAGAIGLGSMFA